MAYCATHGEIINHPLGCTQCQKVNGKKKKDQKKAFNKFGYTQKKKTSLSVLKERAQAWLRKIILNLYCKNQTFTNCWICLKPVLVTGSDVTKVIHVSHYFPKGVYWRLAFIIENLGLCCYDCNCNNQGIVPAMRPKLVSIHGEEKIKQLEANAEKFMLEKRLRMITNQPDEFWLLANIEDLKKKHRAA